MRVALSLPDGLDVSLADVVAVHVVVVVRRVVFRPLPRPKYSLQKRSLNSALIIEPA
jgi:hypothetical protein